MSELEITISDLQDIAEILTNNGYGGWAVSIGKAISLLKEQEERIETLESLRRIEQEGR